MGTRQLALHGKRVATMERQGLDGAGMLMPSGIQVAPRGAGEMRPPAGKAPTVRAVAGAMGLTGPIGGQVETRDRWVERPSPSERATVEALRTGADIRVASFYEEKRSTHLQTALGWFQRFQSTVPSRVPFVPYENAGDLRAAAYNEETFRLFAEFIRQHGSVRSGFSGMAVSSTAIADYISAIRAFRSREAGYNLLMEGGNLRLPRQIQHMRREDGPAGQRALSRGLTARLLRKLLQVRGFSSGGRAETLRWAVLWVGHNLMLRGGEPGTAERVQFSPLTGLTVADVDWVEACEETRGFPVAVVDVMPIKDTHNTRQRIPCPIRRCSGRQMERLSADPVACAWEALRRWWLLRKAEVVPGEWASAPLFARVDGSAVNTADVKAMIRQAAEAVGEEPNDFDARALRIGGATDLYHIMGGPVEAERVIQKRGRWCSMIGDIYTRLSATAMMSTSAAMVQADGVDLEAFRHGYVMPAVVHRSRRSY